MDIKYKVIRDTREQNGWTFMPAKACEGTVSGTLKTGDYSIEGYQDILTIERKGSIAELATNLVEDRFERELERMQSFKYAFMILEFSMDDLIKYPKGTGIPSYKMKSVKLNPFFLLKRLIEIELKYKVKIIFCENHGQTVASSIFKRVIENEGPREAKEDNRPSLDAF
jgi:ERCC4-type nuclease